MPLISEIFLVSRSTALQLTRPRVATFRSHHGLRAKPPESFKIINGSLYCRAARLWEEACSKCNKSKFYVSETTTAILFAFIWFLIKKNYIARQLQQPFMMFAILQYMYLCIVATHKGRRSTAWTRLPSHQRCGLVRILRKVKSLWDRIKLQPKSGNWIHECETHVYDSFLALERDIFP